MRSPIGRLAVAFVLPLWMTSALAEPVLPSTPIRADQAVQPPGWYGDYHIPNESNPVRQLPALRDAPAGALVTVGTTRGFIGAALAPNVTHLFLLDLDPRVVFHNQVEIALLRTARDRADYTQLRFECTEAEWIRRLQGAELGAPLEGLVANRAAFEWWRDTFRRHAVLREDPGSDPNAPFHGANYVHSDTLFNRLRDMARAGRIETAQVNLSDEAAMRPIWERMAERRIPVSVLDLSNAWMERYMPPEALTRILNGAHARAAPRALFLGSGGNSLGAPGWSYYWTALADLPTAEAREAFARTLQEAENGIRYGHQHTLYRIRPEGGGFAIPDMAPPETWPPGVLGPASCPMASGAVGNVSRLQSALRRLLPPFVGGAPKGKQ